MPRLACKFCAHSNPEGSKFCNECGSPLNFAPCPRCEAINSVSDRECFQCGAPLSWFAAEETPAVPVGVMETSQSAEGSATGRDSVPLALADRLELPWDPHALSQEPHIVLERDPSLATEPAGDAGGRGDEHPIRPLPGGRADYGGRTPGLALGICFGLALIAIAGAVYWASLNPTLLPGSRTATSEPPATTAERAESTPAAPPQTADAPTETRESAAPVRESKSSGVEAGPPAAGSSESPTPALQSKAAGAEVQPTVTEKPPKSADAQLPSKGATAKSSRGGTTKTAAARASSAKPPSTLAPARTAEQEERDAVATRRLIERELAGSAPSAPDTAPAQ